MPFNVHTGAVIETPFDDDEPTDLGGDPFAKPGFGCDSDALVWLT
jgi:hypothetical protein